MNGSDLVVWLPWALLLSAGGVALAVRSLRRGDRIAALRWTGWALLPPALLLTGTLRLVGRVAGAVLDWAAGLVFTPATWLGVLLAGSAAALLATARTLRLRAGRRRGTEPARPRRSVARRDPDPGPAAAGDADLAEIEEILRRRGIS